MDPQLLQQLDESIQDFRVAVQRPSYSRSILKGIGDDVSVTSVRALRAVARLTNDDKSPSIQMIASELGVEHSTASRLIDSLVKGALLTKDVCGADRRHTRISLTEDGQTLLDQATEGRRQVIAKITENWSHEDIKTLAELLSRLSVSINRKVN